MAKFRVNCGCEDFPCCNCDEYAYTGEDAIEQMREQEDAYPDDYLPGEDMDGDHQSALASAGFGTDEDYGYYGPCDDAWYEDQVSGDYGIDCE